MPKQHSPSNTKLITFLVHGQFQIDSFGDLCFSASCSLIPPVYRSSAPIYYIYVYDVRVRTSVRMRTCVCVCAVFGAYRRSLLFYICCVYYWLLFSFSFFLCSYFLTVISLPQGILILVIGKHLFVCLSPSASPSLSLYRFFFVLSSFNTIPNQYIRTIME